MEQKVLLPPVLYSFFINYINAGKGNGMTVAPIRYSMAGSSTAVKLEDIPKGFESILAPFNIRPLTYADDFNGSHTLKINKYIEGQEFPAHRDDEVVNYAGADSDCIITDTWFSMGKKPTKKLLKIFKPYQVNEKIMSIAKKNAVFMHCLPATRGNEVTEGVIDNSSYSLVWSEAENRLHIQKAILEWCLKKI